jgi:hypothetical protein
VRAFPPLTLPLLSSLALFILTFQRIRKIRVCKRRMSTLAQPRFAPLPTEQIESQTDAGQSSSALKSYKDVITDTCNYGIPVRSMLIFISGFGFQWLQGTSSGWSLTTSWPRCVCFCLAFWHRWMVGCQPCLIVCSVLQVYVKSTFFPHSPSACLK